MKFWSHGLRYPMAMLFVISWLASAALPQVSAQTAEEKPVALIGDEAVYERDYLPPVQNEVYKVRVQEYELKRNALEDTINRRLLRAEAEQRGISEEELLLQEVDSKVPEPSNDEVEQRLVIQMFRGGMPSNTNKEQIAQELKQGKIEQARDVYFAGLRERAGVQILLAPPRRAVSPDPARIRGNPDAPITIVEFSDFQCPFCYQKRACQVRRRREALLPRYAARRRASRPERHRRRRPLCR